MKILQQITLKDNLIKEPSHCFILFSSSNQIGVVFILVSQQQSSALFAFNTSNDTMYVFQI